MVRTVFPSRLGTAAVYAAVLSFAASVALASPPQTQPRNGQPAPQAAADGSSQTSGQPATDARRQARRRHPGPEVVVAKMWWNQPKKVEELKLTDAQRQAMDRRFSEFLEARAESMKSSRASLQPFGEALAAGDADGAREVASQVASAYAEPLENQLMMMVDVIGSLTAEQRQILDDTHPGLLRRLWLRNAPLRAAGSRPESP